jgi:hypothetical protein
MQCSGATSWQCGTCTAAPQCSSLTGEGDAVLPSSSSSSSSSSMGKHMLVCSRCRTNAWRHVLHRCTDNSLSTVGAVPITQAVAATSSVAEQHIHTK